MRTLRALVAPGTGAGAGLVAAAAVSVGVAWTLTGPLADGRFAPLLLPGVAALTALLWVCLAWPLAALAVAFVLLAVVPSDPAPVDVVLAVLVVTTLVSVRVRPVVPAIVAVPLGLFVVVSLLSVAVADHLARAVIFEFTTLYLVVLAVWLTWVFRDRLRTLVAIQAYLVAASLSGVAAALALYVGFPGATALLYDDSRAEALFKDPNVFGPFLVPAAAILLEELARPRLLHWPRSVVAAAFLASTTGVVVAFSRAGWLNYAIATGSVLLVYAFRHTGLRAAGRAVVWLAMTALAGLVLLASTGSLTFLEERTAPKAYDQARFSSQREAFAQIDRAVLGNGPGQTEPELPLSTHSVYARATYEQGAPGLLLLVLVFLATLLGAIRIARDDVTVHGIGGAALLGSWLGLLANGAFVDTLHWRHLWVVAALIWVGTVKAVSREGVRAG